jgi:hypothetical protein
MLNCSDSSDFNAHNASKQIGARRFNLFSGKASNVHDRRRVFAPEDRGPKHNAAAEGLGTP